MPIPDLESTRMLSNPGKSCPVQVRYVCAGVFFLFTLVPREGYAAYHSVYRVPFTERA